MVSIKIFTVLVILTFVLAADVVGAASKKQRHHIKHKKSNNNNNNGKSKGSFKQAPVQTPTNQRNPKMNYYNTHNSWPSVNSFYRPTSTTPFFQRSPAPTMYYPTHWGNSYYNTPSLMSSNMLRRSDDFSSNTPSSMAMNSAQLPMLPMTSSQMPLTMSMGNSQTPTIIDMSAFAGSGLMDNPFTSSSQNMWSMGDVSQSQLPKPKFNFYNSFNYNDDGPFANLFNQFV